MLDLVFTDNPSLGKHSQSIPGISDHAMVVTDSDVKPIYNKQNLGKFTYFQRQIGKKFTKLVENFQMKLSEWFMKI